MGYSAAGAEELGMISTTEEGYSGVTGDLCIVRSTASCIRVLGNLLAISVLRGSGSKASNGSEDSNGGTHFDDWVLSWVVEGGGWWW